MDRRFYRPFKGFHHLLSLLLFVLAFSSVGLAQGDTTQSEGSGLDGKALFQSNCASCHSPGEKVVIGPGLKDVQSRWEGKEELLYEWIKNPAEVKAMGDPYVNDLLSEWESKAGLMQAQPVNDKEIDAILAYVEQYEPPQPKGGEVAQAEGSGKTGKGKETDVLTWLIILAVVFLIVIFSLGGVRSSLLNAVRDKEGREPVPDLTFKQKAINWMSRHKVVTSLIIIFLIAGGLKDAWDGLMGVGVYQGYHPEQPIKFSHKVHAGENQISCVYCHSGAEKGKYSLIPSANVCMNCHSYIEEGTNTGKEEIAKIYKAVDYDPSSKTYGDDTKPIKWVKVHELPDFAYFNHSQHVEVAGLECQECHGEVEKMGTVEQHAELTMGWCLDCHNTKRVDMKKNDYYKEIHDRMTNKMLRKFLVDDKITVRELGGWECAKCHY